MPTFSIKDLAQLSGIKAHTLRIWEKRYNILIPQRTSTNIRFYSEEDLKLILKIALLNRHGLRISLIADMSKEEITEQYYNMTANISEEDYQISALTTAMIEMEENQFEKIFNINIEERGFERTILDIIYPFMERIGILWLSGGIVPAQEHFMSNLVRQKLIVAIDKLPQQEEKSQRCCILFLPESEQHEIGLLFAYYMLKVRNHNVVYLGPCVPADDIIEVAKIKQVRFLFTLMTTHPRAKKVDSYIEKITTSLPDMTLFVGGYQTRYLKADKYPSVKVVQGVRQFFESVYQELLSA